MTKEKSGWECFLDWEDTDDYPMTSSFMIPTLLGLFPGMILCVECLECLKGPCDSILISIERVLVGIVTIFCGFFAVLLVNIVGNIIRFIKKLVLNAIDRHNAKKREKVREYKNIEYRYSRLVNYQHPKE